MTHRTDSVALNALEHLLRTSGRSRSSIFVLLDGRTDPKPLHPHIDPERIIPFESWALADKYNFYGKSDHPKLTPGNTIFPLLDFAQNHTFDFYWLIEYDVRFNGDWSFFFDHFDTRSTDLLGTTFFRYAFRPTWDWWKSLRTPLFTFIRKREMIRGLFPVTRLSKRAVDTLISGYKKGWNGHYEVVVPTLLKHAGLSIQDIGGSGEFTAPDDIERFYVNSPQNPLLAPGTFVCPPAEPTLQERENMLFHGIKR